MVIKILGGRALNTRIKGVLVIIVLIALAGTVFFAVSGRSEEVVAEQSAEVEVSVTVEKEKIVEFLGMSGVELGGRTLLASSFIPDTLKLVFTMEENGDNSLLSLSVNGREIEPEVMENILQNYLDFNCSLVYN